MRYCETCKGRGELVKLAGYNPDDIWDFGCDAQGYEIECPDCRGNKYIKPRSINNIWIGNKEITPLKFRRIKEQIDPVYNYSTFIGITSN